MVDNRRNIEHKKRRDRNFKYDILKFVIFRFAAMSHLSQRKMSLPPDQRIKPNRMMHLKCTLITYAAKEAQKRQAEQVKARDSELGERIPARVVKMAYPGFFKIS